MYKITKELSMEQRKMENLGISTSLLGFGCMRFPEKNGQIDEETAERMLTDAYNNGVNYFDTAYVYHGGKSEGFTGRVLNKFPRDSYYVATKLPCWSVYKPEDTRRIFEEQLKNLDKDCIDFYLLHSLNIGSFEKMVKLGVIEECLKFKAEGKIKYLGFSFHDSYESFEKIINYRDWDFCQIQLNYMDEDEQAGIKGYRLAESKGVPVVVMEPVKGGMLAKFPEAVSEDLLKLGPDASIASWAMRWVGELPGVAVVLSGMSNEEQVTDNLKTFGDFKPLTDEERAAIASTKKKLLARVKNPCTGCRYCMPCPYGVDIPRNFSLWNRYGIYENAGDVRWNMNNIKGDDCYASKCVGCGKCEKVCPQKIAIRDDLKALQKDFDVL
jgi:predicted aldo/keto reductase-like oxidoreductase